MMMTVLLLLIITEEVRTQLIAHDRTIGFHDVRLAELDLRVQCAETTNYDGILIWKIIDYLRRKREAVAGACLHVTGLSFGFFFSCGDFTRFTTKAHLGTKVN